MPISIKPMIADIPVSSTAAKTPIPSISPLAIRKGFLTPVLAPNSPPAMAAGIPIKKTVLTQLLATSIVIFWV